MNVVSTSFKLVDEMMQSAYLCIILHVKHKKLPFIAVLTRFLIIGKIQDGGYCYQIKYTLFFKKIKGFPLKTKSFRNTATYKKLRGGVPSTPSSLVPWWGYEFACTSEG